MDYSWDGAKYDVVSLAEWTGHKCTLSTHDYKTFAALSGNIFPFWVIWNEECINIQSFSGSCPIYLELSVYLLIISNTYYFGTISLVDLVDTLKAHLCHIKILTCPSVCTSTLRVLAWPANFTFWLFRHAGEKARKRWPVCLKNGPPISWKNGTSSWEYVIIQWVQMEFVISFVFCAIES